MSRFRPEFLSGPVQKQLWRSLFLNTGSVISSLTWNLFIHKTLPALNRTDSTLSFLNRPLTALSCDSLSQTGLCNTQEAALVTAQGTSVRTAAGGAVQALQELFMMENFTLLVNSELNNKRNRLLLRFINWNYSKSSVHVRPVSSTFIQHFPQSLFTQTNKILFCHQGIKEAY